MKVRFQNAFTLIELLIVVAIIAILAAISVPNLLEAQTRAKTARAKSDLRTIVTALEAYRVDNNAVPRMCASARCIAPPTQQKTLQRITTPIAYLSGRATFSDPFPATGVYREVPFNYDPAENLLEPSSLNEYFYTTRSQVDNITWSDGENGRHVEWYLLESSGPDRVKHMLNAILNHMTTNGSNDEAYIAKAVYDPTNGTVSQGSIWRVGGVATGKGEALGNVINRATR